MVNAKNIIKHGNVHYINKNYLLQPTYNDENECINDTLSLNLVIFLRGWFNDDQSDS